MNEEKKMEIMNKLKPFKKAFKNGKRAKDKNSMQHTRYLIILFTFILIKNQMRHERPQFLRVILTI